MRTLDIRKREEIEVVIRSCKTCYVSMCENNMPYVVPMNFALDGDSVIIHSAQEGRKWDILKKNPNVCINWTQGEDLAWQDLNVGCSYRVKSTSVIIEGVADFVEEVKEKERCMAKLMAQYSPINFKFSLPSIINVGVIKVLIKTISAKKFGAKSTTVWTNNAGE
jgi:uncharacterized protein